MLPEYYNIDLLQVSFHSEMRAVRVSRQLEMKRLSRLEAGAIF